MGRGVGAHAVVADGVDLAAEVGLVARDRHVELARRGPQHVERVVVNGASADLVGPDHAGDEAVHLDTALELAHGQLRILLR